ncbi:hypothetical protein QFZ87_000720 [Bacillus sp. SLBN-46]|uniref:hypothetical protein n=1 Tax=Bacillus sp. SLBN-46 TaxID=3042283 RepID=UPI00285840AC|nr:hypothetical protein [Bacillus sp. SLBN-46]MDR6121123.1 hypothetical protein [Bacillus sp. SLBN-46]
MSKKKKKDKKCECSNQKNNPILQLGSLPRLQIIPIRDIPDNCQLVCVGPFCTLACFGTEAGETNCDIICDDAGNCTIRCMTDNNG